MKELIKNIKAQKLSCKVNSLQGWNHGSEQGWLLLLQSFCIDAFAVHCALSVFDQIPLVWY